jgi:invasion protein IalB
MNVIKLVGLLTLLSAANASAAGPPVAAHSLAGMRPIVLLAGAVEKNAWTKFCFRVPDRETGGIVRSAGAAGIEDNAQACFTYAELRDPSTQTLMSIFGVLQVQPSGRSVLIAFLPIGQMLPPDPGSIQLDDTERIQLEYLARDACDISGCYVRASLTPMLLDRMKSAKPMSAYGVPHPGHESSLPLPCCEFGAALDGKPTSAEARNDQQRKIQKVISRRFADFVR